MRASRKATNLAFLLLIMVMFFLIVHACMHFALRKFHRMEEASHGAAVTHWIRICNLERGQIVAILSSLVFAKATVASHDRRKPNPLNKSWSS